MNTPKLYNNNPRWQLPLAALLTLLLSAGAPGAFAADDDELEVTMEIISASSEVDAFEMQLAPLGDAASSITSFGAFIPFGAPISTNPPNDQVASDKRTDDLRDEEAFELAHDEFDERDAADEMEQVDDREDVREDEHADLRDDAEMSDADESMNDVFDDVPDDVSEEISDELAEGDESAEQEEAMDEAVDAGSDA
jgi:hypothetical protein